MKCRSIQITVLLATIFLLPVPALFQEPNRDLDSAIETLRGIVPDKLSDAQKARKVEEIEAAWERIKNEGTKGTERLKNEVSSVLEQDEKDDFFLLNASALLWDIGELNEARTIAEIWGKATLSAQYNYVFYTAMEAARTKDAAATPMLTQLLRDANGFLFFPRHSMRVTWPLTHEFIWGAFGRKGLPALHEVLERSVDAVELASAMRLLTQAQYLPSLPRIRQLAEDGRDEVRFNAIKSLGIFGHPDDYDRLIAGVSTAKGEEAFFYAFGLYEFDDERAVPHLIPLLKADDELVKKEVMLALLRLLTPESFEAVKREAARLPKGELKDFINRSITLRQEKLPSNFVKRSRSEKARLLDKVRNRDTALASDARKATRAVLHAALKEWTSKGRIYGSAYEWLEVPQMIAAGTPEDIDALLEAKSIFYLRLSDECLYETRIIDTVVKYIGRSRYRKGVGVTARAVAN